MDNETIAAMIVGLAMLVIAPFATLQAIAVWKQMMRRRRGNR